MNAANRVVFNTGILYGRIIVTVCISLFTTRIVLDALGAEDYGIFNLIAGVIVMLSFLKNAMATSTQRFLSFFQGKNDKVMQAKIFWNSLFFHLILGVVILILLEIAGLFLFDGFLNIPLDKLDEAKTVYRFMAINVFFLILSVPYNGSLVAHENMIYVALINILEVLLKLAIAISLYHSADDKLVVYGLMMAGISSISFTGYALYCIRVYEECKLKNRQGIDKKMLKELGAYASWNLFGSLCSLGRTQGLAVILNLFFGAIINSAYAIANQVGGQLMFLSTTMLKSINPQIMKSEGNGDRKRMLRLALIASKFGFFLLSIVAVPFIFEMDNILAVWLKEVPDYAAIFCKMVLVGAIINQLTIGLQSAIQATGRIKAYQATVGSVLLLNLPLAFLLLKMGFAAYSVLAGYIVVEFIACCLRLYFLHLLAGLSVQRYLERVIYKEVVPLLVLMTICLLSINLFDFPFRFLLTITLAVLGTSVAIYLWGLCEDEREIVSKGILKIKQKVTKKKELALK
ncbi:hypothetical protein DN752_02315 [Echinicola strongylocentroti]|uniref:Polysaccharide biosynthesis protein n=1 Tax=Echinicola strongylocentroti TaxID=1795355 RepID=A0A2Z4IF40_9BACT|nr:hypothetical protein [Echinicola strongylocentroti]AWW29063.1 hypothetical protein DN752_02315 [Echinicola strongylocentroti]